MTNTSTLINRFSRIFITALLFFPLTLFCQEVPSADKKDGWAIQVGAGYLYSGNVGILAERQILLKNSFRVSPFASTGFAEGGESAQLKKYYWYGNSAGEHGIRKQTPGGFRASICPSKPHRKRC